MKKIWFSWLASSLLLGCPLPSTPPGARPSPQVSPTSSPRASVSPNPNPTPVAPAGEVKFTRGAQCEAGSVWILPKDEVIAVAPCPPPASQPAYIEPAATRQMTEAERKKAQSQYASLAIQPAPAALGSLTPDLPLATGMRSQCQNDDGVVFLGGLLGSCNQYLVQEAQNVQLLKNGSAFQSYFAPIESAAEAASYAIARSGSDWKSSFPEIKENFRFYTRLLRRSRVETTKDGFQVLLYAYAQFGCGPHSTYAITYQVGRDGSFSETTRQRVWEDPALDGLCAD